MLAARRFLNVPLRVAFVLSTGWLGLGVGSGSGLAWSQPPLPEALQRPSVPLQLPPAARPGDSSSLPDRPLPGQTLSPKQVDELDNRLLQDAKQILTPNEKSLALERIARSKIQGNDISDLNDALTALMQAAELAPRVEEPLLHDLRIKGVIGTMIVLTEAQVREAMTDDTLRQAGADVAQFRKVDDRLKYLEEVRKTLRQAGQLAQLLRSPTSRSELMDEVAEAWGVRAQSVATEVIRSGKSRRDLQGQEQALNKFCDSAVAEGIALANRVERPLWRDRALGMTCLYAAQADLHDRSLEAAALIKAADIRTLAILRAAESLARLSKKERATELYQVSAETLVSIPDPDVRTILAGVLVDSLVSVGRFDDARRCVELFPTEVGKVRVLGAIAESQGRRGLGDKARIWIRSDVDPKYRSTLERRVIDGMLGAIDENRGQL